jgi:hypothetical protein
MKNLLLITALTLPLGVFAQGNTNINPQVQIQNVNYFNQIEIHNDLDSIQTHTGNQQANPPVQDQQFAEADPPSGGQSSGNVFSSDENNKPKTTGCKDCDAVKQALKASQASSSGSQHKKYYSIKQWSKIVEGKMNLKMKKVFANRYRARTSYAICFNWH